MKTPYRLLTILFLLCSITLSQAQLVEPARSRKLWPGLESKQPESDLPKGNAPFQTSKRKAKQPAVTKLIQSQSNEWIISDGWEMAGSTIVSESEKSIFDLSYNTNIWINATVPGTVLTSLVEQGIFPDPYFGLNNLAISDSLARTHWWYRNVFEIPQNTHGERICLLFNGINYRAEVFLNGRKLGNIEGAFIRGEFDITNLVKKDAKNILAVHILPTDNPGIPHEQSIKAGQGLNGGHLSLDGPTFISSIGWDWIPGIRDRNIGIWQDVRLRIGGDVQVIDPQIITDVLLPDTTRANIAIHTTLRNRSSKSVSGKLIAAMEGFELEKTYSLAPGEEKELHFLPEEYKELQIKNPRLWWPNGYGAQPLYNLELRATVENTFSDLKKVRFGIREMSYELMVYDNEKGNTRIGYTPIELNKNGKPLFNYETRYYYTPDNQLPTLQEEVKLEDFELLDPKDPVGPFFVIRVNGVRIFCRGGNWGMDDGMKRVSRERLEPYVKLHQDMNFNIIRNWTGESTEEVFYELCDEYGMLVWNDFWITTDDTVEPKDQALFLRNATDAVRRFRNHPSIAVWCPRNEGFAPKGLSVPLTAMLAKEDPTRHYHGQSRFLNMGTSGPWSYFEDPSKYYTDNAKGFNTEMGTYAIPTAETIRKFIAPEDQWPINDVWAYHDLHHTSQNFPGFMKAVNRYGEPTDMDDFVRKSQFVCYDAWRNMLEAWNSRIWDSTTGLVLWMSHPAWPSMIWQTYTYDYETPGSFFGAKKACEPLHVQMNLPDNDVVIINTTRTSYKKLSLEVQCFDLQGKLIERKTGKFDALANQLTNCNLTVSKENKPDIYLVRLILKDNKGKLVSQNDYWKVNDESAFLALNNLAKADLEIRLVKKNNSVFVEVKNTGRIIALAIKLNAKDSISGETILPAYFSEGYFNLLPGEKKTIQVSVDSENYRISASGYNL